MTAAERKVIEWTPGKWWVVLDTPGRGYWPLHEGKGTTPKARKADAERWLAENPS